MLDQIVPTAAATFFSMSRNDFGSLDKSFRGSRGIGKHENLPQFKTIDIPRWYQTPKLFFDTLDWLQNDKQWIHEIFVFFLILLANKLTN